MKKLFLAALLLAGAFGIANLSAPAASATDCSVVLCNPCPEGYVMSPTPGNCCRCVRI